MGCEWVIEELVFCSLLVCFQGSIKNSLEFRGGGGSRGRALGHRAGCGRQIRGCGVGARGLKSPPLRTRFLFAFPFQLLTFVSAFSLHRFDFPSVSCLYDCLDSFATSTTICPYSATWPSLRLRTGTCSASHPNADSPSFRNYTRFYHKLTRS